MQVLRLPSVEPRCLIGGICAWRRGLACSPADQASPDDARPAG
ncbi:hypothetical protein XccvBFoX4_gp02c [Xanthomonas phage FoX4]|uniref:Uncharacterized protein n=1 Tax=Xanthomonas phage FoX4 TaxID=2723900 RepID=A0A858XBF0_9CAUD|nr:hypothetical protein KNU97_gp02 [Xanthomonas phage FoX4]QJI52956.1 hypothetical protein XccvBFoX4_gp02c [Xanthomonas phage FoX4]